MRGTGFPTVWTTMRFFLAALAAGGLAAAPATASDVDVKVRGILDVVAAPRNQALALNVFNFGGSPFDAYTLRLFAEARPADKLEVYTQILGSDVTGVYVYGAYAIYTPSLDRDLHVQAGKIPSPIGTFAPRAYSNKNPLMGTPLMYYYHTTLKADQMPASVDELLANAGRGQFGITYPPGGYGWRGLPLVYEHCWDVGAVVLGSLRPIEFTAGVVNGTPSSMASGRDDNDGKSILGRIGYAPVPGLRVGMSGAFGPYVTDSAEPTLPSGKTAEDYNQRVLMADFEYLVGHAEVRAEGVASTWETPFVGNPTAHSYYVEGKYSFPVGLYLAARWDELRYTKVKGSTGPARPWDDDVRRFEGGAGYRIHKNLLAKAAYQSITQDSGVGANSDRRFDILAASAVITF